MGGSSGSDALRAHRRAASEQKKDDVSRALLAMGARGAAITVSAVAREAGVSREFIHSHPGLHAAVQEMASKSKDLAQRQQTLGTSASARAGAADRLTLAAEIQRLRARLKEQQQCLDVLHAQRRRWLGSQLRDPSRVDPAVHAELRSVNERLMSEKAELAAAVADLRRTVSVLEYDLAAVREALAQELAASDTSRAAATRPPTILGR